MHVNDKKNYHPILILQAEVIPQPFTQTTPVFASHLAENDWGVGWKMHSRPHEQVCLQGDGVWRPRGRLAHLPCTRIQGEEEALPIRRRLHLRGFEASRPWNQVRLLFFLRNNHQKCGFKVLRGVWFRDQAWVQGGGPVYCFYQVRGGFSWL